MNNNTTSTFDVSDGVVFGCLRCCVGYVGDAVTIWGYGIGGVG